MAQPQRKEEPQSSRTKSPLTLDLDLSRPTTPRRSTEPTALFPQSSTYSNPSSLAIRTRNRSPYSRTHQRTKSSTSASLAPPMTRAHTSPVTDTAGHVLLSTIKGRPSSPLTTLPFRQSPLRKPSIDSFSSFGSQLDIGETISENSELDLTPKATDSSDTDSMLSSPLPIHHTFPRSSRRRPSSPLHHIVQSTLHTSTSNPTLNNANSPNSVGKFKDDIYPSNYSFSSSSMPSTPTSLRSRSPSISSLETIPDSPDAEEAAQEADIISRLKAAADSEAAREDVSRRRGSLETMGRGSGGMVNLGTNGFGVVYGSRDKRKRWSVCGAERRGDLDLETIWED